MSFTVNPQENHTYSLLEMARFCSACFHDILFVWGSFYEHACLWLREARLSFRESILAADIPQSFESMPSAGRLQEMWESCKEVKRPDGLILDNPRRQWRVGI